ncbi:hypothetical protein [Yersinia massiliensis]|uniref:hypothetical protein n=2 Tax=Yersinia massiliensis TaxID=419257 RepID=UPI0011A734ED|nr:hypothetical protein [Yersinia massiliensis]
MKHKRFLLLPLSILLLSEISCAAGNLSNSMGIITAHFKKMSDKTSSACFYKEDFFEEKIFCLTPPMMIDFTLENNIGVRANDIQSIRLPENSQLTVYQGDRFFTLTGSILRDAWKKLAGMGDITQIIATDKKPLMCDTQCIITQRSIIPISTIFSHDINDIQQQERSLLLSFERGDNNFDITFNNLMDVTVDDGIISILPPNSPQIDFSLHQDTTHISFLFSWYEKELSLYYLETVNGELRYLSPQISMQSEYSINQEEIDLAIFNSDDRQPLILQKVLLATHREAHRDKRGALGIAGCFLNGPLALYNVVTQGRCDQVESAWHQIKTVFSGKDPSNRIVAGTAKPLKPTPHSEKSPQENTNPTLVLTQLKTDLHGQSLTLPAVSKYCQTSIDNVIAARYPRQTRYSCATWLSSVLADFTMLFGSSLRTWSTEYLIQTINGILDRRALDTDRDAMEAFIQKPNVGNRLIQTITDVAEEQDRTALIEHITHSFLNAEQNYAQYALNSQPQGASNDQADMSCYSESDDESEVESESENDSDSGAASPRQAQQYPLGSYQMQLATYDYQDVLPRILINGEWQVASERFDIEVIQGTREQTRQSIYHLLETVAAWENTYYERRVYCNRHGQFTNTMETNRYAGQITSQLIRSHVQYPRSDNIIIVVRLNNRIVSTSLAHNYFAGGDPQRQHSTISATLTDPAFVLTPQAEGTIRGAGSAALHAMLQHLKVNGVSVVHAEVISTPSAMVKKRIGFVFIPEVYGLYNTSPTPPPHSEL